MDEDRATESASARVLPQPMQGEDAEPAVPRRDSALAVPVGDSRDLASGVPDQCPAEPLSRPEVRIVSCGVNDISGLQDARVQRAAG